MDGQRRQIVGQAGRGRLVAFEIADQCPQPGPAVGGVDRLDERGPMARPQRDRAAPGCRAAWLASGPNASQRDGAGVASDAPSS